MFANNFLILGVNPSNNEKGVPTNSELSIQFASDMDVTTLTKGNLVLRKVNGNVIDYDIQYVNVSKKVILVLQDIAQLGVSIASLETNTQYQIRVIGGTAGVKSITGNYLPESRNYEFTTTAASMLTEPTSLSVAVTNGYPVVTWTPPDYYNEALALSYEVMISRSSLHTDPPVWPSVGDVNSTSGNTLNVPKQLADDNYYAYVRVKDTNMISGWTSTQFLVETAAPLPGGVTTTPGPTSTMFDVSETYPKANEVNITPDRIIIMLTSNVDATSVTDETVYLIRRGNKDKLSLMDFLTDYAPSKRIPATLEPITGPTNIIQLIPAIGELVDDEEYTVVVRESVKSDTGETLGESHSFTFMSHFSVLYGDIESIRSDIGPLLRTLSDKALYKYVRDVSQFAFQVVSGRTDFIPTDYEGGKAPYYVHQYVRFQAGYDLLLNAQLHSTGGSGSSIKLGDLAIDKTSDSADISSMLRGLKDKIKPWLDMLHGHNNRGYAKPVSVVKGEVGSPYPEFMTRAEFAELGE